METSALGGHPFDVRIRGDMVYWTADEGAPFQEQGFIVEWRPPSAPRVLVRAMRPHAAIHTLSVSENWMAWAELQDRNLGADARIYVLGRGSTQPTLVDDIARHGPIATFSEMTLDGSDLYWTIPRLVEGVWRGQLLRKRLPDGAAEVLESGDHELYTWPSAFRGAVAYEVVRQESSSEYRVRYRTADGVARLIDVVPASEPAIGPGYIAFKRFTRYDAGPLAVLDLRDGRIRDLGSGEAPIAVGDSIVYFDISANEGKLARVSDGCTARYTENRSSGNLGESAGILSGSLLAWPYLRNDGGNISPRIRIARLAAMPC